MGGQRDRARRDLRITMATERTESRCDVASCREPLDLHQPDPGNPGRLLGTCPKCGTWYVLDEIPGRDRTVRTRVPSVAEVRVVLDRQGPPDPLVPFIAPSRTTPRKAAAVVALSKG